MQAKEEPANQSRIISKSYIQDVEGALDALKISYDNGTQGAPKVEGVIVKPKGAIDGSLPLVVFNTPGTKIDGTGYANTISNINDYVIPFCNNIGTYGAMVVASSLREKDEYGGQELQDIFDLIHIAKQDPHWNGQVVMIGVGRGAMMTYLAARQMDDLTVAVAAGGVTDLYAAEVECVLYSHNNLVAQAHDEMVPDLDGKLLGKRADLLKSRSAVTFKKELQDKAFPIYAIHGRQDSQVKSWHSENMDLDEEHLKLYECGHEVLLAHDKRDVYYARDEVVALCNKHLQERSKKVDAVAEVEEEAGEAYELQGCSASAAIRRGAGRGTHGGGGQGEHTGKHRGGHHRRTVSTVDCFEL